MLSGDGADEVLVLRLPRAAGFHLDLAMTLVDTATLAISAPLRRVLRGVVHRRSSTGSATRAVDDVLRWACDAVIEIGIAIPRRTGVAGTEASTSSHSHQAWSSRTTTTNERNDRLEQAGVTVVRVPGRALAAGRGGPHCLACPLVREP